MLHRPLASGGWGPRWPLTHAQHGFRGSGSRGAGPCGHRGRRWRLGPPQAKGKPTRPSRPAWSLASAIEADWRSAGAAASNPSISQERPQSAGALGATHSWLRVPPARRPALAQPPSQLSHPSITHPTAPATSQLPPFSVPICPAAALINRRTAARPPLSCRPASPTPSPSSGSGGPMRSTSALWRRCGSTAGSGAR